MPVALDSRASLVDELAFANGVADGARSIARRHYRHPNGLELKSDRSPVTLADREIEWLIRGAIEARYPGDGILGEETGLTGQERRRLWVVDPIDGTGSFATGNPLFGTLIGLCVSDRPVLGLLDACATGERWVATSGQGASMNGLACRTSGRQKLSGAAISFSPFREDDDRQRDAYRAVMGRAAMSRLGGDCYSYGLLALGHLDAVMETGLKPYDFLPLVPIVEEAGGVITDWKGAPLTPESGAEVVAAASAELHAQILEML